MAGEFTLLDGERLIRFGRGTLAEAPRLLSERGFDGHVLLSTERWRGTLAAGETIDVPPGRVDEVSAEIRPRVGGRPLVALGGGRVVDVAKALAGADGLPCAAIPTTLSGAELTGIHRLPAGSEGGRLVRPSLVVADPALMASQPMPQLAASALNAVAHAVEALYTPLSNPVAQMAGARAMEQVERALAEPEPDRDAIALGALLAGYACGLAGYAFHHALCQTIVRLGGTPHAETNAVMLPHCVRYVSDTTPEALAALGPGAVERVARLASRAGPRSLTELGFDRRRVSAVVDAVTPRAELRNTPRPPSADDLHALVEAAL